MVLDRSGSMETVRNDTIGGFNKFLTEQQAVPGEATVSLYQFNHDCDRTLNAAPIKDAKPLARESYAPSGNTCLFGAVGLAIQETGELLKSKAEHDRPEKVVCVIITDGEENSSHKHEWSQRHTQASIKQSIEHQTNAYKWQFVYIGANQDAILNAATIGIGATNALNYTHNAVGTEKLYKSASSNLRSFRMASKSDMSWEATQRKEQDDAKAATP